MAAGGPVVAMVALKEKGRRWPDANDDDDTKSGGGGSGGNVVAGALFATTCTKPPAKLEL